MVDVFEEVEDQIRAEQYKSLGLKVLPWVIGVAVLALAIALGYWGWTSYQTRNATKASDAYIAALQALSRNDIAGGEAKLAEVAKSPAKGYRTLALMQLAGLKLEQGKTAEGVKFMDEAAAASPDPMMGDMARLKSAFALLDTAPYKDLEARLTPLTGDKSPYRLEAKEALAFLKLRDGKLKEARADFVVITGLFDATQGQRERAKMAISTIDSGSAKALGQIVKDAAVLPANVTPPQPPQGPTGPDPVAQQQAPTAPGADQ